MIYSVKEEFNRTKYINLKHLGGVLTVLFPCLLRQGRHSKKGKNLFKSLENDVHCKTTNALLHMSSKCFIDWKDFFNHIEMLPAFFICLVSLQSFSRCPQKTRQLQLGHLVPVFATISPNSKRYSITWSVTKRKKKKKYLIRSNWTDRRKRNEVTIASSCLRAKLS